MITNTQLLILFTLCLAALSFYIVPIFLKRKSFLNKFIYNIQPWGSFFLLFFIFNLIFYWAGITTNLVFLLISLFLTTLFIINLVDALIGYSSIEVVVENLKERFGENITLLFLRTNKGNFIVMSIYPEYKVIAEILKKNWLKGQKRFKIAVSPIRKRIYDIKLIDEANEKLYKTKLDIKYS